MNTSWLTPQPALTADETLAADLLMAELLLELTGDTVIDLQTRRTDGPVADVARGAAQRRASA